MMRLDEIVEEVIRRLKIYLNEKRILIILRDDSDFREVIKLVTILKEKGYTFHLLSLLTKDIKVLEKKEFSGMVRIRSGIFKEEDYAHFMDSYESIVVSDLKLLEAQAYQELYFSETLGKLIFHTLRENKPVYALSKEMGFVKNDYLKTKMDEIKDELAKLKIHLLTEKISGGMNGSEISDATEAIRASGALKNETRQEESQKRREISHQPEKKDTKIRRDESAEGLDITEKFITLSDVMSIKGINEKETLRIGSQSRLTMEASDHLGRLGVRLLRITE